MVEKTPRADQGTLALGKGAPHVHGAQPAEGNVAWCQDLDAATGGGGLAQHLVGIGLWIAHEVSLIEQASPQKSRQTWAGAGSATGRTIEHAPSYPACAQLTVGRYDQILAARTVFAARAASACSIVTATKWVFVPGEQRATRSMSAEITVATMA